jgi:hypothetical protein
LKLNGEQKQIKIKPKLWWKKKEERKKLNIWKMSKTRLASEIFLRKLEISHVVFKQNLLPLLSLLTNIFLDHKVLSLLL